jgi:quercetin dioxygenase-like cupin family protein
MTSLYFVDKSDCSAHTIFPGIDIYTMAGSHMMLSLVEMRPDSVVEDHAHPHEQMGMLLEGRATFYVGEEQKTLEAGEMYRIPGGVTHRVVASNQGAKALDFFHPVREDYL